MVDWTESRFDLDIEPGTCGEALAIRGVSHPCTKPAGHSGWQHENTDIGAAWGVTGDCDRQAAARAIQRVRTGFLDDLTKIIRANEKNPPEQRRHDLEVMYGQIVSGLAHAAKTVLADQEVPDDRA